MREIGRELGVSKTRAGQMVYRATHPRPPKYPKWTAGLSPYLASALCDHGFRDKEQVRLSCELGEVTLIGGRNGVGSVRGIGKERLAELYTWLGMEAELQKRPYKVKRVASKTTIERAIALLERNGYRVEKLPNG